MKTTNDRPLKLWNHLDNLLSYITKEHVVSGAKWSKVMAKTEKKTDFFKKIKIFHFLDVRCEATQACMIKNLVSIVAFDECLQARSNE